MPRVNVVKKAAKDYPEQGIKKGQEYFWWKFRFGPMVRSKEHPKPWQLTRSEFYSTLYQIQDALGKITAEDVESLQQQVQDLAGQIRELGEECQEKHDNMPDSLQDSETGELLTSRAEAMESAADELEGIDFDNFEEPTDDEVREELEGELGDEKEPGIGEEELKKRKEHNTLLYAEKIDEIMQERLQEIIDEVQNVSLDAE